MGENQTEVLRLWQGGPLLRQAEHARLTTDAVLLADFARVYAGECGADLGCASGVLMLLLLWREESLHMTGFELLQDAAELAAENLRMNSLNTRAEVLPGDMRNTVRLRRSGEYDFVIANPPYFPLGGGVSAPDSGRAVAREERSCSFPELCCVAARLCRSGGRCFFSYRPERLREMMDTMAEFRLETKRLRFVHHSPGHAASLVLVEGRRDGNPGLTVQPPLILFSEEGAETEEYRRIYHRV